MLTFCFSPLSLLILLPFSHQFLWILLFKCYDLPILPPCPPATGSQTAITANMDLFICLPYEAVNYLRPWIKYYLTWPQCLAYSRWWVYICYINEGFYINHLIQSFSTRDGGDFDSHTPPKRTSGKSVDTLVATTAVCVCVRVLLAPGG